MKRRTAQYSFEWNNLFFMRLPSHRGWSNTHRENMDAAIADLGHPGPHLNVQNMPNFRVYFAKMFFRMTRAFSANWLVKWQFYAILTKRSAMAFEQDLWGLRWSYSSSRQCEHHCYFSTIGKLKTPQLCSNTGVYFWGIKYGDVFWNIRPTYILFIYCLRTFSRNCCLQMCQPQPVDKYLALDCSVEYAVQC